MITSWFPVLSVCAIAPAMFAQANPQANAPASPNQRLAGILPNYRTAEESDPFSPLSVRRKFYIGYKDSTDYPVFIVSAGLAGISQATGQHESLGPGFKGYSKRLATTVADQLLGNMLTESILPSLLRQDPRYFRRGKGGVWSRLGYSTSRVFVARNDQGNWVFNFAEVGGNAISAAIGNAYYPGERHLLNNVQRFSTLMVTDALSQILREFWPDLKRKFFTRPTGP